MHEPAPVVLLIEDEPQIRRFVRSVFEDEGWEVHEAENSKRGLIEAGTRHPDLIILDLGLPDGDGIELIKDLRNWSNVPVVVLSARAKEADKIAALDAGADDYLTKPFGVGELMARVRSTLRRERQAGAGGDHVVRFGDVAVDLKSRQVMRAGAPVRMTPTEFRLLSVLVRNAGRVVSNPQLLREVWGPTSGGNPHYLRIYMGHLRQKLEANPTTPQFFLTETGVGYRLFLPQ